MNLENFEDDINYKILDRGYDYYIENHILDCTEEEFNTYHFEVEGSEDYEVIVKLDDNKEIIMSYCNCPYDYGPICKHEVAAYYYLKENECSSCKSQKEKESVKKNKFNFNDVIENLTKEQLIDIIKELTCENNDIKEKIIFKYSVVDNKEEFKQCKKLMKSIINKYIRRNGYIDYYSAGNFVDEISCILDKVRDIYCDNIILGLDMAEYYLLELINVIEDCDDSDGFVYSEVYNAISVINSIAERSVYQKDSIQEEVFKRLIKLSRNKNINEFEYHTVDFLKSCIHFCIIEKYRNILKEEIQKNIENEAKSQYGTYKVEPNVQLLFKIINSYETKKEIEEFINKNIYFTSFRADIINYYIKIGNYEKALNTALDGEKKDKDSNILVNKWKECRYNIYKTFNKIDEQEKLGRELILKGYYKYYKDLKEIHKNDHEVFYTEIINEFKSIKNMDRSMAYLSIIIEENDSKEILDFITNEPFYIEAYIEYVINDFKDESEELYKKYILNKAKQSNKRSMYKSVCSSIKRFNKLLGKDGALKIRNELLDKYKRKPAFIDELKKVKLR